ncbi:MAG: outer membrane protein assembly factor BamD [Bacteroidetes bacterium]|nr:outer membrane protein assembly factor BamD [Bacteroidota bacterium]MBS1756966.1 outer membrane protein assembly factor BamD [Bacteroidota bacterium]
MRIIRNFLALFLVVWALSSCSQLTKIEKSKDADYKLTKADEFYAKKKYRYAQQLYEELFPSFKGSQKFEDLYYKYAYCFYYDKTYSDAENLFKGYLETFPNSPKAEEVDYMRSYCYFKQSPKLELEQVNTVKAMNMMQSFINTHPGSLRIKDANEVIEKCRAKLELKDARAAELYYNLTQYRAAALAFADLLNSYPESAKAEQYKLMVVKSYYKFAKMSYESKQVERFEKVTTEYEDFVDRFPDSKLLKEAEEYSNLSKNHIKEIQNEQITSSAK